MSEQIFNPKFYNRSMKYKLEQKFNPQQPHAKPKWYAAAVHNEKMETEAIRAEISERTTVNSADTIAVLEALVKIIPEELSKGTPIYLAGIGTFRMGLSSEGVLNPNDFTVAHINGHHVIYTPDVRILHALEALLHFEDSGIRGGESISIYWVEDKHSEKANEVLTSGKAVRISGQKIKLEGEDSSVGLKLLHVETQQEYPVPMEDIPVNKAKEIIFIVPQTLPQGHYQLRLVTQHSGATTRLSKTPSTYTYEPAFALVDAAGGGQPGGGGGGGIG
ncbi:MAG: DUF4469 domain-containing protein [Tannerellaceae bacterium]|nr:DUF4469 domain-containing protein [Tannerellaceae bacterium]